MSKTSRTSKSLKNSIVSLVFYLIGLIVQFFARKVFLEYLGSEILGLNTTAQNILQFLNLAELGIGTAVGYFLYKPLRERDILSINEIVTLQGILYKRIALIIIAGSIIIMPFFPLIFKKIDLPLWYAYISFGAFLFSSLLGYFFNYKQIVLSADQQNYKILYSLQSTKIIRSIVQIFVVVEFSNPYVWWILVEVFFAIIGSITLSKTTKRAFPFLHHSGHTYRQLKTKYPEFVIKIKQLFFHRIAYFVLSQSSSLIIYAFTTLSVVAYYGNYMLIITGVSMLLYSIFNSVNAGIGNLVAEDNIDRTLDVFKELFSLRFAISLIVSFMVYQLTPSFITLWIGSKYLLPNSTLILLVITLYINIMRLSVESFSNAFGLFSDIYAPIIEAILNLTFSILLGFYYGLNGILSGVLISLVSVIFLWKPYYLFKKGFHKSIMIYIKLYLKHAIIGGISWILSNLLIHSLNIEFRSNILGFLVSGSVCIFIFSIILISSLIIFKSGIEKTFIRFIK